MSKTLIQIISKQTMPNLLAAMAVKPDKIIHVCTPSMKKASAALTQAYREAGVSAVVTEVSVGEKPLMPEMFTVVSKALSTDLESVVNFTGGTKPMSIGAYGAATRMNVPSFYVDTDSGKFLIGNTGGEITRFFPSGDFSMAPVSGQLNVDIITKANGVERVTRGLDWHPYVKLADVLLRNVDLEQECHECVSKIVIESSGRAYVKWPERRKFWNRLYNRPIKLPQSVGEAAVAAGLFETVKGSFKIAQKWAEHMNKLDLNVMKKGIYDAFNEAAMPIHFLNGNWWEVAVARYYEAKGNVYDLRWSSSAGSCNGGNTYMEEDVLGVDGVNLLYVSCKRGGDRSKLSRTVEDVNSSGQRLGGDFAHKILAVYKDIPSKEAFAVSNRCKELRMQILTRSDVISVPAL